RPAASTRAGVRGDRRGAPARPPSCHARKVKAALSGCREGSESAAPGLAAGMQDPVDETLVYRADDLGIRRRGLDQGALPKDHAVAEVGGLEALVAHRDDDRLPRGAGSLLPSGDLRAPLEPGGPGGADR